MKMHVLRNYLLLTVSTLTLLVHATPAHANGGGFNHASQLPAYGRPICPVGVVGPWCVAPVRKFARGVAIGAGRIAVGAARIAGAGLRLAGRAVFGPRFGCARMCGRVALGGSFRRGCR